MFEDDWLECDKCLKKFHLTCVSYRDLNIPFWYCKECELDTKDPTMNFALLQMLVNQDPREIYEQYGADAM